MQKINVVFTDFDTNVYSVNIKQLTICRSVG